METSERAASPGAAACCICPFCGLLCDDVSVEDRAGTLQVVARGCELSRSGFERATRPADDSALIEGRPVPSIEAIAAAAGILRRSSRPLFGSIATDVAGARAALALADHCGAVVDHVNSPAKFRNLLAFQDRGWISTTLAEVRNRAELVVVVGDSIGRRFPRLFERVLVPGPTLFAVDTPRRIVQLGQRDPGPSVPVNERIPVATAALPDALAALSALVAGRPVDDAALQAQGLPAAALRELAASMAAVRYGVVCWAAPDLDFDHAELTVLAISRMLTTLNERTRFAALPLGGNDADFTADAVLLWQTGFPFRTDFSTGEPRYDPLLHDGRRMLANGEADALLWIASLERDSPPEAGVPTILLGGADDPAAQRCDVFLPVGTPGVDHGAHLLRTDKVVSMRLRPARPSSRPTVAATLGAILAAMAAEGA